MLQFVSIPNGLVAADQDKLKSMLKDSSTLVVSISVSLSPAQTTSLLPIGPERAAEQKDIESKLMKDFPAVMPKDFPKATYDSIGAEIIYIDEVENTLNAMKIALEARKKVLINNKYWIAKEALYNGRNLARNNPAIDDVVKDISKNHFSSRVNNDGSTAYNLPPSASVTIANVITGKMCTNFGVTIIQVLKVNGSLNDAVKIDPSNGAKIPSGWTNVVVTNLSATASADFKLFVHQ